MRPLLILLLGALAGGIATIMFQTLDPDGGAPPPVAPSGGGNARISIDADALKVLVTDILGDEFGNILVDVRVEERGLLFIMMRSADVPAGLDGSLVVNPELDTASGDLVLLQDENETEGIFPDRLAPALEKALRDRLVALAGGHPYRVTAITTAGNRLGIELLT